MRKIVSQFRTSFTVIGSRGVHTDCDPLGDHRITVEVRRCHWWNSDRDVKVWYTGYELQHMPLAAEPTSEPSSKTQPPYNIYTAQLKASAGGGSIGGIQADRFERKDGKLTFYYGEFFVADVNAADVLVLLVSDRVGWEQSNE